jgi:hypothetical protein
MAHQIRVDEITAKWELRSTVITFRNISGAHSGENLGRHVAVLAERAGLISASGTKVRCHLHLL